MRSSAIILSLLLMTTSLISFAEESDSERWQTRSGYYWVSYTSDLEPLEINKIHRWVFHIENSLGENVENAKLTLLGGMPEHNHGLPTVPRMTESLGNGDYGVEGMRFHMNGFWELTVTVDVAGRRDTVVIPLTIS